MKDREINAYKTTLCSDSGPYRFKRLSTPLLRRKSSVQLPGTVKVKLTYKDRFYDEEVLDHHSNLEFGGEDTPSVFIYKEEEIPLTTEAVSLDSSKAIEPAYQYKLGSLIEALFDLRIESLQTFEYVSKNPLMRRLVQAVWNRITYLDDLAVWQMTKSETSLAGVDDKIHAETWKETMDRISALPLDPDETADTVKEDQRDSSHQKTKNPTGYQEYRDYLTSETWAKTINWFNTLVDRNPRFTGHRTKLVIDNQPIEIVRLIAGGVNYPNKESEWETDRLLIDTLFFMHEELGFDIPRRDDELLVLTVADTDMNEDVGDWRTTNSLKSICHFQGYADPNLTMISIETGRQILTLKAYDEDTQTVEMDVKEELLSRSSEYVHRHEITHLLDEYGIITTHAEGLADAIADRLDFVSALEYLRYSMRYTDRKYDQEFLQFLMSRESEEADYLLIHEVYNLSATLFSFIAQRVGYKGFGDFYKLLTGAYSFANEANVSKPRLVTDQGHDSKTPLGKLVPSETQGSISTKNNLRESLRALYSLGYTLENAETDTILTTDEAIDQFLDEFLEYVNGERDVPSVQQQ